MTSHDAGVGVYQEGNKFMRVTNQSVTCDSFPGLEKAWGRGSSSDPLHKLERGYNYA